MVEPGAALELEVFVVQGRLEGPTATVSTAARAWTAAVAARQDAVLDDGVAPRAAALAIQAARARARSASGRGGGGGGGGAHGGGARGGRGGPEGGGGARAWEADAAEAAAVKVVSRTPAPGAVVRQEKAAAWRRFVTKLRCVGRLSLGLGRWLDETRARLMQELDQTTGWRRLAPRLRYVGRLRIGLRRWLDEALAPHRGTP